MRLTLLTLLIGSVTFILRSQDRIMTLQECVNLAVENNLNVQRSKLNLQTSYANQREAWFSRFPNLSGSGGHTVNWGRGIDNNTNQFVNQRFSNVGVSISGNTTLYAGNQINNSIKQSQINAQTAKFDLEKATNDVILDVVTFYLNVIFNKELLENARFQLRSSTDQLVQTSKMVQSGALPRSNELELESQVATNEVNVITAENNLNLAFLTLKQVMLVPVGDQIDVIAPEVAVETPDLVTSSDEVFNNAEKMMPEIKSRDLMVQSARLGYRVSKGTQRPTIFMSYSIGTNYSDFFTQRFVADQNNPFTILTNDDGTPLTEQTLFQTVDGIAVEQFQVIPNGSNEPFGLSEQFRENLGQSISFGLNIPIFNGYQARLNTQRSQILLQQAEINAQEQRNILRQTIETAYNDVQAAQKTFDAANKQVEALTLTFENLKRQLENGAANSTDYNIASNNLNAAQTDLTRAKFDYIFKKKLLDFYQGKPIF